jgi:hypothetical protein
LPLPATSTARGTVAFLDSLVDRCVEVYTEPTGPAAKQNPEPNNRKVWRFGPDDPVSVILGGREVGRIAVNEILP